ncbi:WASP-binding domain of Sorting nexin protein, partial [Rhizoctonia solani]
MTAHAHDLRTPLPDFDAGLNSSTAWKKHLSISDVPQPPSPVSEEKPLFARAVRDVLGNEDNRELGLKAGEAIEILNPRIGDEWALAKKPDGDMGLIPHGCYVTIHDFTGTSPSPTSPTFPPSGSIDGPIRMQSTGESIITSSLYTLRQSVLGGKSLNRFSHFVVTGAEEWIINGYDPPVATSRSHERFRTDVTVDETDKEVGRHYVEVNLPTKSRKTDKWDDTEGCTQANMSWREKTPAFNVLVHSPEKHSSVTGAYTLYSVTSIFPPSSPEMEPTRITVHRRFSHFNFLHTALSRSLPGIVLPPLPAKQYAGRFQGEFVEARRGDLEKWLQRIVRHPVVRYTEVVVFFLGCENDLEWKRLLPTYLSTLPAGPAFYASVFHPDFNLDVEDCSATIGRFEHHVRVFDERIGTLRGVMGGFREARNGFLGVVSEGPKHDHEHETEEKEKEKYLNDEGVWCWRDGCEDCLHTTKAVQKMAECMQGVANLHEDSAKRTTLAIHDMVKDMSHPSMMYGPLIDTHKQALARYRDSESIETTPNHDTSSRCETVLHTTLAELETYHTQRAEDLTRVATEYLDEEIALYEQVLTRLRAARAGFEQKDAAGRGVSPVLPTPVPQPTAHVYDPAPARPVSTAVNMLIDGIGASGDKTGLKFWS